MTRRLMAGMLAACALLVACGEQPQTAGVRKGDVAPSAGTAGTHMAPGWQAGDATGWEKQLNARTQGQNEYARTN